MEFTTKVSIQILSYNAQKELTECLKNFDWVRQEPNVQIFLVDNASTQNNYDVVKRDFPFVNAVRNQINTGFANGHQRIYEMSQSFDPEYVLVLNPDVLIKKEDLLTLVTKLEKHPDAAIIGPQVVNGNSGREDSIHKDLKIWMIALKVLNIDIVSKLTRKLYFKETFVEGVTGACMLVRNEVIKKIGLFVKEIFFYVEDIEFCTRVRKNGWKILYTPDVTVFHGLGKSAQSHGESTVEVEDWKRTQMYLSQFVYFRKHRPFYERFLLICGRYFEMYLRIVIGYNRKWAKSMLPKLKTVKV